MRRIATPSLSLAALLACGCASGRLPRNVYPDPAVLPASGALPADAPPVPRLAREAVPDSVMLRDQIGSQYQDSPAPY